MKELTVCVGSSCHLKGSYQVMKSYEALIKNHHLEEHIKLKASFCQGHCQGGVAVSFDGVYLPDVTIQNCEAVFMSQILPNI